MNVIPAIDLRAGACVRLYQGDFAKQTDYPVDPLELAARYASVGFSDLHLVDLDGAESGEQGNRKLVAKIAGTSKMSVQLGGGIRSIESMRDWFDRGVDRCVIGSIAVNEPDLVKESFDLFGADKIVLALDVRIVDSTPMLLTHGWTRESATSLWESIDEYRACGLRHVLCTDIEQDGAMSGPNLDLYREFVGRYPDLLLQASGGVRSIEDLGEVRACGAASAITGRALLDGRITDEEIVPFLRAA